MTHPLLTTPAFEKLLQQLRSIDEPETAAEWPTAHWDLLQHHGIPAWNIETEFGGQSMSSVEQLDLYRLLAGSCLVTTFILTQRNAACLRVQTSANTAVKRRLLPAFCAGKIFGTVGISHLTTSRQHLTKPAVVVQHVASQRSYLLNGCVPWASGAPQSDIIVTGGTLPDGRQILAAISRDQRGLEVRPPIELMGLSASQTGAIQLTDVLVPEDELLHGPVEKVMSSGAGGGAGSLGTSAVALGAAQGTLRRFAADVATRHELHEFFDPLQQEADCLTTDLHAAAAGDDASVEATESLRQRANSLVIRSAQVWLAATKGAGYVAGHPAERAVRESMFFLVWSCPRPVLDANLRELSCGR